ncbi:MAG TPA: aldo/keto reductase [Planctomycetota bacterium]|nr:aldo/keto reductase [Planctomycetota bacterium]
MPTAPFPLPHGQSMPALGLGTYQLTGTACEHVVAQALELGYRHIDTAVMYGNHREVGRGIAASGIDRRQLFVTSKVWRERLRRAQVREDCERTLDELGLDYLDLWLIHWPHDDVPLAETLGAMAELRLAGLVRNIGVSNFTAARLARARAATSEPIACNQVEYHVHLDQHELAAACRACGTQLVAYSPLAKGEVATDPLLRDIAARRGMSASQVALRWLIEKAIVPIPKTSSPERLVHNLAVLDQRLEPGDVNAIDARRQRRRLVEWDVARFEEV